MCVSMFRDIDVLRFTFSVLTSAPSDVDLRFTFPFISYPLPLRVLPLSQGEKVGDGIFLCPSKIGGEEGLQKND